MITLLTLIKPAYAAPESLSHNYGFGQIDILSDLFLRLRDPLINIAAIALFFYIIFGAFRFLTSGGDKEAVESGRRMITHGIIGALLLILTFVILKLIPEILGLGVRIIP